jgi:hypothetical protein
MFLDLRRPRLRTAIGQGQRRRSLPQRLDFVSAGILGVTDRETAGDDRLAIAGLQLDHRAHVAAPADEMRQATDLELRFPEIRVIRRARGSGGAPVGRCVP